MRLNLCLIERQSWLEIHFRGQLQQIQVYEIYFEIQLFDMHHDISFVIDLSSQIFIQIEYWKSFALLFLINKFYGHDSTFLFIDNQVPSDSENADLLDKMTEISILSLQNQVISVSQKSDFIRNSVEKVFKIFIKVNVKQGRGDPQGTPFEQQKIFSNFIRINTQHSAMQGFQKVYFILFQNILFFNIPCSFDLQIVLQALEKSMKINILLSLPWMFLIYSQSIDESCLRLLYMIIEIILQLRMESQIQNLYKGLNITRGLNQSFQVYLDTFYLGAANAPILISCLFGSSSQEEFLMNQCVSPSQEMALSPAINLCNSQVFPQLSFSRQGIGVGSYLCNLEYLPKLEYNLQICHSHNVICCHHLSNCQISLRLFFIIKLISVAFYNNSLHFSAISILWLYLIGLILNLSLVIILLFHISFRQIAQNCLNELTCFLFNIQLQEFTAFDLSILIRCCGILSVKLQFRVRSTIIIAWSDQLFQCTYTSFLYFLKIKMWSVYEQTCFPKITPMKCECIFSYISHIRNFNLKSIKVPTDYQQLGMNQLVQYLCDFIPEKLLIFLIFIFTMKIYIYKNQFYIR
ncbi:unnamed protein product (macronuclear) [Paramecium tetraurelia]|uniref:Transmembrane protein n=1 Tax=Paramecium tetraurelia TaxID=5888 RepID=A0E882_PARTE|nr:uncharacterized protein GSPATT00024227001 [Paramecium tetraurelia]CAK91499.1 unnamed protein product [Paramecium tetraurelia]|eukprot:XP_001458896.1 hypothetical protein (macronuclear) [Paramecium tetraurelia strain d4-2]